MTMRASHIELISRLDLIFEGNLDLSIALAVCDICKRTPAGLRSCILDLRGVERVFDSGVALLRMLYQRLTELGIPVVILSDNPRIRKQIPFITGEHWRIELLRRA